MVYTKANLARLEDVFLEAGYSIRVAKGAFRSGNCVLKDTRIVLLNSFLKPESRFQVLIELLPQIEAPEAVRQSFLPANGAR